MDLNISGRKALITGGDSGIGLAAADLLLEEGVNVVIASLNKDKVDKAVEDLSGENRKVFGFSCNVADLDSLAKLDENVQNTVGDIDILVNCAGITGAQGLFHEIDDDGWIETIQTNLVGAARVTKTFLSALRKGGWGRLIFISSEDAVQPYPEEIPYCTAKAGVLALAKGLSKTYAKEGLLVNSVSPAFIATPMTDKMMEKRAEKRDTNIDEAIESFLKEERPHIELKRRGKAEEVAAVIGFLCSDRASFVNGANYRVDGGSVASI